jgi:hypothetical protein
MGEEVEAFLRLQYAFAGSLRDPKGVSAPVVASPQRIQIYRQLILNNFESFLATGFPILKATLGEEAWPALIVDFLRLHKCQTPYLFELGEEFLTYLQEERGENQGDPPFLLELAHYEWVELALAIAQEEPPMEDCRLQEDPLSQAIYLSELAWPLVYRFPVHRIGPSFQPRFPPAEPVFLLGYRDREDEVRFLEISSEVHSLLDLLQRKGPMKAKVALAETATGADRIEQDALASKLSSLLADLARRAVIGAI